MRLRTILLVAPLAAAWCLPGSAGARDLGPTVSISGDTAVFGTSLFVRSGTVWSLQQTLAPPPGVIALHEGAVSISGDTLVAYGYDSRAHVYVRSGTSWSFQATLTPSDGGALSWPNAIAGDTVVVGGGEAAYVFVRSGPTWTQQQKLVASDGAPLDLFGAAVSISGDTIVVGAVGDDTPAGQDAGSAYVFVRSGMSWTQQQKLLASDGAPGDVFGDAVAVDGNTIVVGAYFHNTVGCAASGGAYVFVRSGTAWTEQQAILASDRSSEDFFGWDVAVSGDVAVVGAIYQGFPGADHLGAAYVFVRSGTTWTEHQKLTPTEGKFGFSLSLTEDSLIVLAPDDSTPLGSFVGSAYVYTRSGTGWTRQQKLPPLPETRFYTLPPCRLWDSRTAPGGALAANSVREIPVHGRCQIPNDAWAVAAVVTAINPGESGHLQVYAKEDDVPSTSVLNLTAGRTRAGNGVLLVGVWGAVNIRYGAAPGSAATTHFSLDVFGYFK